ncbi:MAG: hypothetical protein JO113_04970 [Candidatus Eremiobacteraeota bacterium]|nr:hypothetical protein [Candidatus Eremiobacteraeota bacterium]
MNRLKLDRCALRVSVLATLLAGCGGLQPSISPPPAMPRSVEMAQGVAPASSYGVLLRFLPHDGGQPEAGLLDVDGTLYGTTYYGGINGLGTVFSVTTAGTKKVLHRFTGLDGEWPYAGLIAVNGTLYGTTHYGGPHNAGIVFSITTTGEEKVLYGFGNGSQDGTYPVAGLIDVNGTLYGTTYMGGTKNYGTIFSLTTTGIEKVLYSFRGGSDGSYPAAGLIDVNDALYGTTYEGGSGCASGCGTVFRVTKTGKEKVLHRFDASADGAAPSAGLLSVNGTLYGTTVYGGSKCGSTGGCGTVFSVTTTGKENVLYSFGGGSDGGYPWAGLVHRSGRLYGTTAYGGANADGTVFSVTATGEEKVLYSFSGGDADGENPFAGLIDVKGTLYGTTYYGGNSRCFHSRGCGIVFALTP